MSNYQRFQEALMTLQDEKIQKHCRILILHTQICEGVYGEYKALERNVKNVLEQYFEVDTVTNEMKQKEDIKWDIFERFAMYLYFNKKKERIYCTYIDHTKESDPIVGIQFNTAQDKYYFNALKEEAQKYGCFIGKSYNFSYFLNTIFADENLFKNDLSFIELNENEKAEEESKKILKQCFKSWQKYKKGHPTEDFSKSALINLDNLSSAMFFYQEKKKNYNKETGEYYFDLSMYDPEQCFNKIFGDEQTNRLINLIENDPIILPMYLAPMIDELTGDRNTIIRGKNLCITYNPEYKRIDQSIPKYKEDYKKDMEKYEKVMDKFVYIYENLMADVIEAEKGVHDWEVPLKERIWTRLW